VALSPGTRLGVYEVTAQIGRGRHGRDLSAKDTRLKGIGVLPAREGKFREAEAALDSPTQAQRRNGNYHHGAYLRACVCALVATPTNRSSGGSITETS